MNALISLKDAKAVANLRGITLSELFAN